MADEALRARGSDIWIWALVALATASVVALAVVQRNRAGDERFPARVGSAVELPLLGGGKGALPLGKVTLVDFWATWCAPCREEMPAFARLQSRWADRNVQFVGLANDDPRRVERFGKELGIPYPLWVGGDEVGELSKRLGNRLGVLPHTVLVDRDGQVLESRVGPYSESLLEERLQAIAK